MTNLIEQYEELHNKVKERALYINDMLAELELPEHLENFSTPYCGVMAEALNMKVWYNCITLTYSPSYEDWEDQWHVNKDWIDMEDADVIAAYLQNRDSAYQIERQHDLERLKREAEMFNMMLVPNAEGDIDKWTHNY